MKHKGQQGWFLPESVILCLWPFQEVIVGAFRWSRIGGNTAGWREHFMSPKVSMLSAHGKVHLICKATLHLGFEIIRTGLQRSHHPFSQTEESKSQKVHPGTITPHPKTQHCSAHQVSSEPASHKPSSSFPGWNCSCTNPSMSNTAAPSLCSPVRDAFLFSIDFVSIPR